jgi:hypothetical protein
MRVEDGFLIVVQRDWKGWRTAEVRLSDLQHVHWFQPPGAPRPLVHGYVSCGSIVNGSIPHDCDPAAAPHDFLVCVLRRHAVASAYMELARRADARAVSARTGGAVPMVATREFPTGQHGQLGRSRDGQPAGLHVERT